LSPAQALLHKISSKTTDAGRNGFIDPSVGLLLLIGDFTVVFDSNGNFISGPTGNGQITDISGLIQ
jgi:hypothetical protein